MSEQGHLDLKVKPFKWIFYLKPFFLKEIVDGLKNLEKSEASGFLCLLQGIYAEFGIGQKVSKKEALEWYEYGTKTYFDPFCSFRLAEMYSDPNHMSDVVQTDFQISWQYLLVSSSFIIPRYDNDPLSVRDSMAKIKNLADADLIFRGSKTSLLNIKSEEKDPITRIIIQLIRFQLVNDKFEEQILFNQIIDSLCHSLEDVGDLDSQFVWELLMNLFITQNQNENNHAKKILQILAQRKGMQLVFIQRQKRLFELVMIRLPQDNQIFRHFRYVIFEFHSIRQYARKINYSEIDNNIDKILAQILQGMFETTRHNLDEVTQSIFIVRCYAEQIEKMIDDSNDLRSLSRVLDIQKEEFSYNQDEDCYAYTYYSIGKLQFKLNQDKKYVLEQIKKAEKLFLERFQRESIHQRFIAGYFLGRINQLLYTLFPDDPKLMRSVFPLKSDLSQMTINSYDYDFQKPGNMSTLQNVTSDPSTKISVYQTQAIDYFCKAYELFQQRETEFYNSRTFQFQVLLEKLQKKLQALGVPYESLIYEPNINNFFSINSIRANQIFVQTNNLHISQQRSSKSPKMNSIQLLNHKQIQIKSLLKRGEESQLYSAILKIDENSIPCLVKIFVGLNHQQCDEISQELNKWKDLPGVCTLYGIAIESLDDNQGIYQLYLVQEGQTANLHQMTIIVQSMQQRLKITQDLVRIVKSYQDASLIHGNLKPQNILLRFNNETNQKDIQVMINDFGWQTILWKDIDETYVRDQTYGYSSPEALELNQISKESDIWSLGILILQIFSDYPLTPDAFKKLLLYENRPTKGEWVWLEYAGLKKVSDLVGKMIIIDPKKRATIEQVLTEVSKWK